MARLDPATTQKKLEKLASLELFKTCTKEELALLTELTVEADLPAGSILTYEDQVGGLLYVLLDGQADVIIHGRNVVTLGPGDVIGEMALLDHRPRTAKVVAITNVRVLEINEDDFKTLLDRAPDFVEKLRDAVATRQREPDSA